jgi:hypothetical protein
MNRFTLAFICVFLALIVPNFAQNTVSYTYEITADLPATPTEWVNGTYSTSTINSDDSVETISLGFSFQFFGTNYTTVTLSSNGNLQFATSSSAYSPPTFPTSTTAYLPVAAFFFSDLNPADDASGPIMYRTEGIAPERSVVIRYANVTIISSTDPVYCEITISENGIMSWGYYHVPLNTRSVTIGVQSDVPLASGASDYTAVWNGVPMNETLSGLLQGKRIVWSRPPVATPAQFATNTSGEYQITHVPSVTPFDIGTGSWSTVETSDDDIDILPVGFSFIFYGVSYSNISMSSNGYIQLGSATSSSTSGQAVPNGNSGRTPLIAAFWVDLNPRDEFQVLQYATVGEAGSRQFVARWQNISYYRDAAARLSFDVILHESTNQVEIRYYRLDPSAITILIALQNQTTSQSSNPGFAYLVNSVRIDANGLLNQLSNSTVLFTPSGGQVPLSSTGAAGGQSSVPVIPDMSSSASVIPTESSSAAVIPTESSSAPVIPTESSSAPVIPTESSSAPVTPTESSSATVIPTESSSATVIPTESSTGGIMEPSTAAPGVSSVIVIPTGCSYTGNVPDGTLVNEMKVNRGIESLGQSFGPQFINTLNSFVGSVFQNAALPTFGCAGVVGFNGRTGNVAPENENESVVRVYVIPNSGSGDPNSAVITPDQASNSLSDPSLNNALLAAGLPSVIQTEIVGKQCPDGRVVDVDSGCDDDDDDGLTDGELAGIIVGSVVGGLLLIGLCICLLVSLRRRKSYSNNTYHSKTVNRNQRGVEMGEYDRTEVV